MPVDILSSTVSEDFLLEELELELELENHEEEEEDEDGDAAVAFLLLNLCCFFPLQLAACVARTEAGNASKQIGHSQDEQDMMIDT